MSNDDRFRTYLYGAYGTLDKKFKYGMSAKYLLFYKPRVVIGGLYQDDYLQLGSILQKDDARLDLKKRLKFSFSSWGELLSYSEQAYSRSC